MMPAAGTTVNASAAAKNSQRFSPVFARPVPVELAVVASPTGSTMMPFSAPSSSRDPPSVMEYVSLRA